MPFNVKLSTVVPGKALKNPGEGKAGAYGAPPQTDIRWERLSIVNFYDKNWISKMTKDSFQDYYPDNLSYCYGCGCLNEHGLQIKSYWEGEEAVCEYRPKPYYIAIPGYVYGGLIASLIDCHATGTAAAAIYRRDERPMDSEPAVRCVTASLHVDYLRPTPLNTPLKLRAQVKEIKGRKVLVSVSLAAKGEVCARGEVVAVQVDDAWMEKYL